MVFRGGRVDPGLVRYVPRRGKDVVVEEKEEEEEVGRGGAQTHNGMRRDRG
jgi:hypothetical protein